MRLSAIADKTCVLWKKGTFLTTYKHGKRKEVGAKASDAINATVF